MRRRGHEHVPAAAQLHREAAVVRLRRAVGHAGVRRHAHGHARVARRRRDVHGQALVGARHAPVAPGRDGPPDVREREELAVDVEADERDVLAPVEARAREQLPRRARRRQRQLGAALERVLERVALEPPPPARKRRAPVLLRVERRAGEAQPFAVDLDEARRPPEAHEHLVVRAEERPQRREPTRRRVLPRARVGEGAAPAYDGRQGRI